MWEWRSALALVILIFVGIVAYNQPTLTGRFFDVPNETGIYFVNETVVVNEHVEFYVRFHPNTTFQINDTMGSSTIELLYYDNEVFTYSFISNQMGNHTLILSYDSGNLTRQINKTITITNETNITDFIDTNITVPKRVFKPVLNKLKKYFEDMELPSFNLTIDKNHTQLKTKVFRLGELINLQTNVIKVSDEEYKIELARPQSFRPGVYKLEITTEINNTNYTEEQEFAWGLVSVNTNKSMYHPNETAGFEIVVLEDNCIALGYSSPDVRFFQLCGDVEKGRIPEHFNTGLIFRGRLYIAHDIYKISCPGGVQPGEFINSAVDMEGHVCAIADIHFR